MPVEALNSAPKAADTTWSRVWPYVFLFVYAFALFAPTLAADFLRWDDRQNILLNPWIEYNALSLIWTRPYYNMYIPITYTLWTALWHMAPEPWLFHLANVAFHAANTALVYLFARRLTGDKDKWPSLFAALIFAVHPLQVETVAWISTFRDTVACCFSLLACYLVLGPSRTWRLGLATVCFVLSLLSKPSVAVVPAVILFLSYGFQALDRRKLWTIGFWFVPALIASYVTKRVQQLDADLRLPPMDLGRRILVAIDALTFYLQKFFAPYPLAADYGRTREIALDGWLWMAGIGVAVAAGVAIWRYRARIPKAYYYYVGTFVLLVAPVLGIIPFQAQGQTTVSDRYVYMSLIGLGLAFGRFFGHARWRWIGAAVLVVLSAMSVTRSTVWRTNEEFFDDMLAKNENSHVALSSLGVEYILTGRLAAAENVLDRAAKLRPNDVIPRTNLAQLYLLYNRPDRVVNEIVPLLNDREFLRVNQTETRALASAYRLAARALWAVRKWPEANDFFCRWFALDYENEEGRGEIQRFIMDAKAAKAELPNCEVPLQN